MKKNNEPKSINEAQYMRMMHELDTYRIELESQNLELLDEIFKNKTMEKMLNESLERFKSLFIEAPIGIAIIDTLSGQIYESNPAYAVITGRKCEDLSLIDWMSFTHPDDVQSNLDNMALLNEGKINKFEMEKRYIKPNGEIVWIKMTIAPIKTNNKTKQHFCIVQDITKRKEVVEALKIIESNFLKNFDSIKNLERIRELTNNIKHHGI